MHERCPHFKELWRNCEHWDPTDKHCSTYYELCDSCRKLLEKIHERCPHFKELWRNCEHWDPTDKHCSTYYELCDSCRKLLEKIHERCPHFKKLWRNCEHWDPILPINGNYQTYPEPEDLGQVHEGFPKDNEVYDKDRQRFEKFSKKSCCPGRRRVAFPKRRHRSSFFKDWILFDGDSYHNRKKFVEKNHKYLEEALKSWEDKKYDGFIPGYSELLEKYRKHLAKIYQKISNDNDRSEFDEILKNNIDSFEDSQNQIDFGLAQNSADQIDFTNFYNDISFESEEEEDWQGEESSEEGSDDCIDFSLEEQDYNSRIDSYQEETGLSEAVQTGIGQLNGIPVAIAVMDFQFIGGSMGSVVGEKITRLIEYAAKNLLPLIIVCASGGARMQEGSLSLLQMAKISASLFHYQKNKKLFYISILTSPTTGGVTASFGMLGDIIIAEPNADIAFAGKRVMEQTLNQTVPEDLQTAEYLFDKGLFDPIVPRNLLKGVLSELILLHTFFPLDDNQVEH
uniref:acetyl-CoA carboxylase carboxyltransferase beta subunit n=1 Tax=Pereskia aculeata TaxID=3597 RepID=UPI0020016671|nr:acetyl-CoA carboxylase carboxyltransferase beta subunit [Pereskia aculeata]UOU85419.1 acetyl-CoA carboxylase carboxyltransferase beta subunit [Pereskia aculeata]